MNVVARVGPKQTIALGTAAEARRWRECSAVPGEYLKEWVGPTANESERNEQVAGRAIEVQIEGRAAVADDIVESSGRHLAKLEAPEGVSLVVAAVAAQDQKAVVRLGIGIAGRIAIAEQIVGLREVIFRGHTALLDVPDIIDLLSAGANDVLLRLDDGIAAVAVEARVG